MLADRREPHDASFDEVKDRVATAWRNDKAKQAARDTATQLAQATSPDDLKARAKAAGYDAKTQENFKAGGTLPEFTASDLIDNALLTLPANSVSKTPLDMSQGFVVLANGDRKEPDMGDTFNQQRDSIRDRLLATKQGQVFDAYMKGLRKQLEDAGDIAIYQDVIDRAFSTGSTDEDDTDTSVPGLPPVGAPKAPITGPGGRPLTPPPPSSFTPPGSPAGAPAGAPPRLPNSTKPAPAPATKPATPPAPAPKKP